MITAQMIKEKAKELGAGVCGIGDIKYFIGRKLAHYAFPLSCTMEGSASPLV